MRRNFTAPTNTPEEDAEWSGEDRASPKNHLKLKGGVGKDQKTFDSNSGEPGRIKRGQYHSFDLFGEMEEHKENDQKSGRIDEKIATGELIEHWKKAEKASIRTEGWKNIKKTTGNQEDSAEKNATGTSPESW